MTERLIGEVLSDDEGQHVLLPPEIDDLGHEVDVVWEGDALIIRARKGARASTAAGADTDGQALS